MTTQKRRSDRCGRAPLRSPGRPPAARRENYQRFWGLIAAGRSTEDAAIDAGVSPAVGGRWFRRAGGMPPLHFSQSSKPLSGRYLSFAEREEIAILRVQGQGVCAIARKLGRAPSTISRELRRNAATRSGGLEYRATTAQWHADRSLRRPKAAKLVGHEALRRYVQDRLAGAVTAPDGVKLMGPKVAWKAHRSGRRQHRQWAMAWSRNRLPGACRSTFPMMIRCVSVTRRLPGPLRSGPRRTAARADRLPQHRPCPAHAASAGPRQRKILCLPRDHDQRAPRGDC